MTIPSMSAGAYRSQHALQGRMNLATELHATRSLGAGRRRVLNQFAQGLSYVALGLALAPLMAIIYLLVVNGSTRLFSDFPYFLQVTMQNVHGGMIAGGIVHALTGTALITLGAAAISVPIGILTAIYLVEYGSDNVLTRAVRVVVDVMSGLPSIVAGLFAAAVFSYTVGPAYRAGLMGAVALSLLMLPVVVRTSEEMLRLVPADLREAALALGVPRYLVIVKVVLRTAAPGLVTGVMLAVARVIGETAPLLMTVGVIDSLNTNVFNGRMMTLPVYIYRQFTAGLAPCSPQQTDCLATINYDRAWAAALVLLILVMIFNLSARFIAARLAPKNRR